MIDRKGILHIPNSNYAYAPDEQHFCVRLRASRGNLRACTLYYADRACQTTPIAFTAVPMEEVAADRDFSYFEVCFPTPYSRVGYFFKLEDADEWTYYYAGIYTKSLADVTIDGKILDGRSEYYQYPAILRSELVQVPRWLQEACVYNIFPDSFADGTKSLSGTSREMLLEGGEYCRVNHGGTIRGITENLDYIQSLGCNCIYLNPVFTAVSYHKYDTIDYYHVDPCFGTNEDLRFLVEEAHRRDMRVILDGVFNHCGSCFFAFKDVIEKGRDSEYCDWFYDIPLPVNVENGVPNYSCFAYVPEMPKLNTANPKVQKYFADVCRYWVGEYKIDGWRLDVANEVSKDFWRCFKRAAREANPECVLIGEVWENAQDWLKYDLFDSTMDYDFRRHCRDFFALRSIDAAEFDARITDLRMRYPEPYWRAQLNLLDSHDVARFLSLCQGSLDRFKQAIVFQMIFPGVPSVFYGDELGIQGLQEPEYRRPMPWEDGSGELLEFYRNAIKLHGLTASGKWRFRTVQAEPGSMLYSFRMEEAERFVTAYFNCGAKSVRAELPEKAEILLQNHYAGVCLEPDGFLVYKV